MTREEQALLVTLIRNRKNGGPFNKHEFWNVELPLLIELAEAAFLYEAELRRLANGEISARSILETLRRGDEIRGLPPQTFPRGM